MADCLGSNLGLPFDVLSGLEAAEDGVDKLKFYATTKPAYHVRRLRRLKSAATFHAECHQQIFGA
jgi:hypothetical protein